MEKLTQDDTLYKTEYKEKEKTICALCNGGAFFLRSQYLHCLGSCRSIIKLDQRYYRDNTLQHIWCEECYKKLDERIQCEDGIVFKRDLKQYSNTTRYKEEWVECYKCNRKFHSVCVLFNNKMGERNKNHLFICPFCMQEYPENKLRMRFSVWLPRASGFCCSYSLL